MKPPSKGPAMAPPDYSRRPSSAVLAFAAAVTVVGIATAIHRLHGGLFVTLLLAASGWSAFRFAAVAIQRRGSNPAGWWKPRVAIIAIWLTIMVVTAWLVG